MTTEGSYECPEHLRVVTIPSMFDGDTPEALYMIDKIFRESDEGLMGFVRDTGIGLIEAQALFDGMSQVDRHFLYGES